MKKFAENVTKHLPEIVLAGGAAAVAAGVGMIFLPAGLITGGLLAMAGAVLTMLGGEDEEG